MTLEEKVFHLIQNSLIDKDLGEFAYDYANRPDRVNGLNLTQGSCVDVVSFGEEPIFCSEVDGSRCDDHCDGTTCPGEQACPVQLYDALCSAKKAALYQIEQWSMLVEAINKVDIGG